MARRVIHDPIGARIAEKRKQRKWSIRNAAKVAGIAHSSWSRIERGLQSADNRFTVAKIAAALGCPVAELVGATETATRDPKLVVARASVPAIREALLEADLDEPPAVDAPPLAVLEREVALVLDLTLRCDYAAVGRRLPDLIPQLHAVEFGPDREAVLRLMAPTGRAALSACQGVGYPGEAWLAAEWFRRASEQFDDPVMTGYAAYLRAAAAIGCGVYRRGHRHAARAADALTAHADDDGAPEVLGLLLLQSAHTAYARKQPGDGAEYFAEAVRLAGRTGETTTFDLFFGPTCVAFWRVPAEADGGDPDEAASTACLPCVARRGGRRP